MAIGFRRTRRFTTADSFRQFMEGLRSIQLYEDEVSKENPPPQASVLIRRLTDAVQALTECVMTYQRDLLPRYYLGTALALQAQCDAASQLRKDAKAKSTRPSKTPEADGLYRRAAEQFAETARRAGASDIETYALYNEAQTLAKIDDPAAQWDALSLLAAINPNSYTWRTLTLRRRVIERTRALFRRESRSIAGVLDHLGGRLEGVPGVTAAAAAAVSDRAALLVQARVLASVLRALLHNAGNPALDYDPEKDPTFKAVAPNARRDISADFCNKRGYLFWKRCVDAPSAPSASTDLQAALEQIKEATRLVGRASWTPAQLTEARIEMAEGRHENALRLLDLVVGTEAPAEAGSKSAPGAPDPARVAAVITKNAISLDAGAVVAIVLATYGPLPRDVTQGVSDRLSGTLDPAFLAKVLSAITAAGGTTP